MLRVNLAKPLGTASVRAPTWEWWTWATETVDAMKAFEYTVVGYNVTESLYAYVEGFGESGHGRMEVWLAPRSIDRLDVSVGWAGDYGQSYVAVGWSKLMLTGQSGM